MKLFKRIAIVISSLLVVLFLCAFVILRYYEDDVVKYAFDKAKSEFNTKVEMGDADLVFWQTFPYASLHLSDVYIEETAPEKDTLIFAKSVYLEFSLMDLFRGNYDIHSVDVEDAKCEFYRNIQGEDNWHFWKEDNTDTSQFKLALEKVKLLNSRLIYADYFNKIIFDFHSENSIGEGNFSGKQFELKLDLKGRLHRMESGEDSYAGNKQIHLESRVQADTDHDLYTISECEVTVEKLFFAVEGVVNASDKSALDLHVVGKEIELDELVESLSESQRNMLADYDPRGEINLDLTIKGETWGKKKPLIEMHTVMHDGWLKHRPSGTKLENLGCDVRYSSGVKSDELRIYQFNCTLGEGFVKADGVVSNLKNPELNLNLEARIDMEGLRSFFALDTLQVCQGNLTAKALIAGKLKSLENEEGYDWRSLLTSGTAGLENGFIKLKNSHREFSDLSATIVFDKKDAIVQNLSGKVNGSDFRINGNLTNLIPYLSSEEEHLILDAKMNCSLIDFTNLVETENTTSTNNAYKFELPERIEFVLKTEVSKFIFRKFEATNVKGIATLSHGKLTVDPVSFQTADGNFSAQILMEKYSEELYRLNCLAQLQSINIQKLFTEFENFNQEFIQDKHLKGEADASVQFRTMLTTGLEMKTDKLESIIDISIANGELNNLSALQDIAAYIKSNKLVAPFVNEDKFAERMRNITFAKLENVIEIKDRLITIPLMDIRSSALDISAKGTHTFDNAISYAIGFNLRDVLVRKEKDWQEVDDGLGKRLYVSMKGTTENPEFGIDRELAKEVRQEDMQAERQNVKALLKEELGLFKKDNTVGTYKENVKPVAGSVTTLEWEESNPKNATPETPIKDSKEKKEEAVNPKTGPKKKLPKWLEERK